jgi:SPP1 family predicted phage head-tail adaptor
MRAGYLRHQITIEAPEETQTADGSFAVTWRTFATSWASIDPLLGKEYFAAAREQADISHKIRMRFVSGLNHRMRILFGTRIFEIESVINLGERNRELVIMCRESV